MQHYNNYIKLIEQNSSKDIAQNIESSVTAIIPNYISCFDFNSHRTGLLLGNVQSGKTGHMLGVIASAADNHFDFFIILTTDNVRLQKQTLARALNSLDTFCICDESDDIRFIQNQMRKPVILVLKKNSKTLTSWYNNLISSKFLHGRAVFIVDDESDAASLNTKVNKKNISTINNKISEIRKLGNSSFYLQVTATPQSLFLQSTLTGYRPEFVHYFQPGEGYLGGNFFYRIQYSDDEIIVPYPIQFTGEEELKDLRIEELHLPEGMQMAIASFLIASAHLFLVGNKESCSFLIHPSVSISDHEIIANKISESLNDILYAMRHADLFKDSLKYAWENLVKTKPDILSFNKCYKFILDILENQKINIITVNSSNTYKDDFGKGINIIIGGNAIGRGVTFPNLQTTYYCRKSKKPQADTYWQHSRAFGYDRDSGLVRVFLPPSLFKLFSELNYANSAMIEYIQNNNINNINLVYPKGITPTRNNVIDKTMLNIIVGGVNHFPSFPKEKNTSKIDKILNSFDGKEFHEITDIDFLKEIILYCDSDVKNDWPKEKYIDCINSLADEDKEKAILIIRKDRNIGKNTGTLLSPTDRKLGDKFNNIIVLTMYRVLGTIDKGWNGKPLWIPNIKFPKDKFFYNCN
ncbi:hypothetical protein A9G35_05140 [Gilliamella sp. Choc5-1]|jgi:hypothetical protein|uniref:Z1 domain-containing protein n=1 Tax=Gilliamella sp. Choc5-1 TaxID=3120238 RepID=UPI00080E3EF3|nr:Z1 domain-containing protein [Gilliamella apicola]OCG46501.1 hypothetical protein A9G35_05140 [Gilliamella apicola]